MTAYETGWPEGKSALVELANVHYGIDLTEIEASAASHAPRLHGTTVDRVHALGHQVQDKMEAIETRIDIKLSQVVNFLEAGRGNN